MPNYTVAELIADLQKLPQDLNVFVGSGCVYPGGKPEVTDLYLEVDANGGADWSKPPTKCCVLLPGSYLEVDRR
jgi:hypothetical protein